MRGGVSGDRGSGAQGEETVYADMKGRLKRRGISCMGVTITILPEPKIPYEGKKPDRIKQSYGGVSKE